MNHPTTLSFWERESFFKNIDVGIIGCGIVGLNTALRIKEIDPSVSVAIFERGALPEGASTRNAGFACFGSTTELLDDLKNTSEAEVFALIERRYRGLCRLRERVGDDAMTYEAHGGFEIFKETESKILEECLDHLSYFNKHLTSIIKQNNVYVKSKKDFGFAHTQATLIHNTAEGQINSGKMMQRLIALAKQHNILIFNGLKIDNIIDNIERNEIPIAFGTEGVTLRTEEGWEIATKKVVVATNGFARRLMPELDVTPARNQVLITQPIENLKIKGCFHYDKGYYYFRNVGNRILLGGGRNLDFDTEQTDDFDTTQKIQNALKNLLTDVILPTQKIEIDMWWSGILGIGAVKKPIIKHVSPNVVVAVRMGGMGVAIGSLVGEDAANLIMQKVEKIVD
jgi:gamma-glutamylputrescine oxidase